MLVNNTKTSENLLIATKTAVVGTTEITLTFEENKTSINFKNQSDGTMTLTIGGVANVINPRNEYFEEGINVLSVLLSADAESLQYTIEAVSGLPLALDVEENNEDINKINRDVKENIMFDKINNVTAFNSLILRKIGDINSKNFDIVSKNSERHTTYSMVKDNNDDYVKIQEGFVGELLATEQLLDTSGYTSRTGTWVDDFAPSIYTTEIGSTFTKTFLGTKLEMRHFADNRGGIFGISIDGGPEVDYSTFEDPSQNPKTQVIASGLDYGLHTVVATFKGDDPLNPPSGGISRGWGWYKDDEFLSSKPMLSYLESENNKEFALTSIGSNIEMAFNCAKDGSGSPVQWFPEHNTIGTTFYNSDPVYIVDGNIVDFSTLTELEYFDCVEFIQNGVFTHPDDGNLFNFTTTHKFDNLGNVYFEGQIDLIENTIINAGYVCMFPLKYGVTNEVVTGLGIVYPSIKTDGSRTNLVTEKDSISQYYVKSDINQDIIGGIAIVDVEETFRHGKPNRYDADYNSIVWLEHRNATINKLYPQVFENETLLIGESYKWKFKLYTKKILNAYNIK